MIIVELFGHISAHFLNFMDLLCFQLLHEVVSGALVVLHVFVPGVGKLLILESLGIFYVYQLSLLSNPHIMVLSLLLIGAPTVKHLLEFICHHIIPSTFIPPSHFIHDPKSTKCIKTPINKILTSKKPQSSHLAKSKPQSSAIAPHISFCPFRISRVRLT